MMAVGKHRIKNFMTLEYEFSGIRIVESSLVPVDWTLKVNLIASNVKGYTKEEAEANANLTYRKIFYWLETNLPNIVACNVKDENDLYIANLSSNIMMYCPGKATDDMIIQLLHSKISMLSGYSLIVGQMELKGSDSSLRYTFDTNEDEYSLPALTSEYYTQGETRDEFPWWFRDDGFCFEFVKPEGSTESNEVLFAEVIDPMDEFHNFMREIDNIGIVKEPARIIQVERWQPKKL